MKIKIVFLSLFSLLFFIVPLAYCQSITDKPTRKFNGFSNKIFTAKECSINLLNCSDFKNVTSQAKDKAPYDIYLNTPRQNSYVFISNPISDSPSQWKSLSVNVNGNFNGSVAWFYWSGETWTPLPISNQTNPLNNSGWHTITWDPVYDWYKTVINAHENYWVLGLFYTSYSEYALASSIETLTYNLKLKIVDDDNNPITDLTKDNFIIKKCKDQKIYALKNQGSGIYKLAIQNETQNGCEISVDYKYRFSPSFQLQPINYQYFDLKSKPLVLRKNASFEFFDINNEPVKKGCILIFNDKEFNNLSNNPNMPNKKDAILFLQEAKNTEFLLKPGLYYYKFITTDHSHHDHFLIRQNSRTIIKKNIMANKLIDNTVSLNNSFAITHPKKTVVGESIFISVFALNNNDLPLTSINVKLTHSKKTSNNFLTNLLPLNKNTNHIGHAIFEISSLNPGQKSINVLLNNKKISEQKIEFVKSKKELYSKLKPQSNKISSKHSQISVSKNIVKADGTDYAIITVELKNKFSQPLSDIEINLKSNRNELDNIVNINNVTNEYGQAVFTIQSHTLGSVNLEIFANNSYTKLSKSLLFETDATQLGTNTLIKIFDDKNPKTFDDANVYYYGKDLKRHLIPSEKIYYTWFNDFNGIKEISSKLMSSLPLGKNVTVKPGCKIITFNTTNKKYLISPKNILRPIKQELLKKEFKKNWTKNMIILADSFMNDYKIGSQIKNIQKYNQELKLHKINNINDIL
jgi:hypothetical protein